MSVDGSAGTWWTSRSFLDMKAPVPSAIDKELDVRGVFRYANAHPLAIRILASGQVRAAPLISHRFPLEKSAEALEMVASKASNVVKLIIEPSTGNSASPV